jgi:hypothetical protein
MCAPNKSNFNYLRDTFGVCPKGRVAGFHINLAVRDGNSLIKPGHIVLAFPLCFLLLHSSVKSVESGGARGLHYIFASSLFELPLSENAAAAAYSLLTVYIYLAPTDPLLLCLPNGD